MNTSVSDRRLAYLFDLEQHGIKLGLDNIRLLCEALGHPERAFDAVLVAGTNGKGSVTAMVERALRAGGIRTGHYTSPHLTDLTERFAVDGRPVGGTDLAQDAARLETTIGDLLAAGRLAAPPTFFEATTAIALLLFRRLGVEMAVLEVGLGGRFDATNVVDPIVSAITAIDLDHQQYLGRTLQEIAFEKAGVIKTGAVVVIGETKPPALDVLHRVARERQAVVVEARAGVTTTVAIDKGRSRVTIETPRGCYGPLMLALRGRHQVDNAVVAVRILEALATRSVPQQAIEIALTRTRWPGRLELLPVGGGRQVLLDGAHNVAAAATLARYLRETYPAGVPLVAAVMRDKDAAGMLDALRPSITRLVCTTVDTPRARPAADLAALAAIRCPDLPVTVSPEPSGALNAAWTFGDVVCAAGSIHLVGALRAAFGRRSIRPARAVRATG